MFALSIIRNIKDTSFQFHKISEMILLVIKNLLQQNRYMNVLRGRIQVEIEIGEHIF